MRSHHRRGVKRHNRGHFPRTGGVEDIGKFVYQGGFTLDSPPRIATVRTKNGFTSVEYIPSSGTGFRGSAHR